MDKALQLMDELAQGIVMVNLRERYKELVKLINDVCYAELVEEKLNKVPKGNVLRYVNGKIKIALHDKETQESVGVLSSSFAEDYSSLGGASSLKISYKGKELRASSYDNEEFRASIKIGKCLGIKFERFRQR